MGVRMWPFMHHADLTPVDCIGVDLHSRKPKMNSYFAMLRANFGYSPDVLLHAVGMCPEPLVQSNIASWLLSSHDLAARSIPHILLYARFDTPLVTNDNVEIGNRGAVSLPLKNV